MLWVPALKDVFGACPSRVTVAAQLSLAVGSVQEMVLAQVPGATFSVMLFGKDVKVGEMVSRTVTEAVAEA